MPAGLQRPQTTLTVQARSKDSGVAQTEQNEIGSAQRRMTIVLGPGHTPEASQLSLVKGGNMVRFSDIVSQLSAGTKAKAPTDGPSVTRRVSVKRAFQAAVHKAQAAKAKAEPTTTTAKATRTAADGAVRTALSLTPAGMAIEMANAAKELHGNTVGINDAINTTDVSKISKRIGAHLLRGDSPVTRDDVEELSASIMGKLQGTDSNIQLLNKDGKLNKKTLRAQGGAGYVGKQRAAQETIMKAVYATLDAKFEDKDYVATLTKTLTHEILLSFGWAGVDDSSYDIQFANRDGASVGGKMPDTQPKPIGMLETAQQFSTEEMTVLHAAKIFTSDAKSGLGRIKPMTHEKMVATLKKVTRSTAKAEALAFKMGYYNKEKLDQCTKQLFPHLKGKKADAKRHELRENLWKAGILNKENGHLERPLDKTDYALLYSKMKGSTEGIKHEEISAFEDALAAVPQDYANTISAALTDIFASH
ncbi:MAG: hypothetical protein O3A01_04625, partial [bacterium]|nr:hypothetical protein [bacterium]